MLRRRPTVGPLLSPCPPAFVDWRVKTHNCSCLNTSKYVSVLCPSSLNTEKRHSQLVFLPKPFSPAFLRRHHMKPTTQFHFIPPPLNVQICRNACEEHGFLFIANHGVPSELIAAHLDEQRRFFALPTEQKRTILVDKNNRGYTPAAEQTLDPANSTEGDSKEGLYFGREIAADSPLASRPLHGPNQWPSETLLPNYRKTVEAYMEAMQDLSMRMLSIMARALDLSPNHFDDYFKLPITTLRPLRYLPVKSNESQGRHAAGAHTDWGILTLLWTTSPGLQIFYKGEWSDVPHVPDAFVVNLGDMLERWTAGRFASTVHRVVNPSGKERLSVAFFLEPDFDALVVPLPGCGGADAAIQYPPITAGQHLLNKLKATHDALREKMESTTKET
jgi:isopenicillin N synthase-like dioxygenase